MNSEKPDDDVQYVVTCTYCGTQTGISIQQLEDNRPLKCRVCGAPLKIVPPPKRPAPKRKKRSSGYHSLHADRTEYERWLDVKQNTAMTIATVVFIAVWTIISVIIWLIAKC